MKVIKVISEHKHNKKKMDAKGAWYKPLYSKKIGMAECVIKDKDGIIRTVHIKNYNEK